MSKSSPVGASSNWLLCPLVCRMICLSFSLLSGTRYSERFLHFACPFPGISHLFKSLGSHEWWIAFRNQDMRVKCAPCCWGFAAPRSSQSRDTESACVRACGSFCRVPSSFPLFIFVTLPFSEKPGSYSPQGIHLLLGPPDPTFFCRSWPHLATSQCSCLSESTWPSSSGPLPCGALPPRGHHDALWLTS